MIKKEKANKSIIAISVLSILLLSILAINITFAYFTSSAISQNSQSMTFGTLSISINDSTDWSMGTSENETLDNLVPGCNVNMAGLVNLTGTDAYLKVTFNVVPSETISDTVATDAIKTALGQVLLAQDVNDWVEVSGSWYCVTPNTGSTNGNTVIDFSRGSVTIPVVETGNAWQGKSITISYTVEAIQSTHVTLAGTTNSEKATSLKTLFDSVDISTGTLTA